MSDSDDSVPPVGATDFDKYYECLISLRESLSVNSSAERAISGTDADPRSSSPASIESTDNDDICSSEMNFEPSFFNNLHNVIRERNYRNSQNLKVNSAIATIQANQLSSDFQRLLDLTVKANSDFVQVIHHSRHVKNEWYRTTDLRYKLTDEIESLNETVGIAIDNSAKLISVQKKNEMYTFLINAVKKSLEQYTDKLNSVIQAEEQLKLQVNQNKSTIDDLGQRWKDALLTLSALELQLSAARSVDLKEFKKAYNEGFLELDSDYNGHLQKLNFTRRINPSDSYDNNDDNNNNNNNNSTNNHNNLFAALDDDSDDDDLKGTIRKPEKMIPVAEANDLKELVAELTSQVAEAKAVVEKEANSLKQNEGAVGNMGSALERSGDTCDSINIETDHVNDLKAFKDIIKNLKETAENSEKVIKERIEYEKEFMSYATKFEDVYIPWFNKFAKIINTLPLSSRYTIFEKSRTDYYSPYDIYDTKIDRVFAIMGRILTIIIFYKQNIMGVKVLASEREKAIASAINTEENIEYDEEYKELVRVYSKTRSKILACRQILAPELKKHHRGRNERSRASAFRSAIIKFIKPLPQSPKSKASFNATESVIKSMFDDCGMEDQFKSSKHIIGNVFLVRSNIGSPLRTIDKYNKMLVTRGVIVGRCPPPCAVIYSPTWRQIIVHNFPIDQLFYSKVRNCSPKPYKLPSLSRFCNYEFTVNQKVSISKITDAITEILELSTCGSRKLEEFIRGPVLFLNPLEAVTGCPKVRLVFFIELENKDDIEDDVDVAGLLDNPYLPFDKTASNLFVDILQKGIQVPGVRKILKTEALSGPMKNVMSQAGFVAHLEEKKVILCSEFTKR